MTTPFFPDSNLDKALTSAYSDLARYNANDEEYQQIVKQIKEFHAIKNETAKLASDTEQSRAKQQLERDQFEQEAEHAALPFYLRVDPNVCLTVAGNIFIGLAVIKYEQTGVISSKVMSFMRKI